MRYKGRILTFSNERELNIFGEEKEIEEIKNYIIEKFNAKKIKGWFDNEM